MSQSLYTAAAGMVAQQNKIDTLADNIANVNTQGFKRKRVDFEDTMYQAMRNPAEPQSEENLLRGTGVLTGATTTSLMQGPLMETGRNLDAAISGMAFFAVQDADGQVLYTRDGAFQTSEENGQHFLVDGNGRYVLDQNLQQILSAEPLNNLTIGSAGDITNNGQNVANLGLFDFVNPQGLSAAGSRTWAESDASGQAALAADYQIRQGAVEGSNVDLAEEMTQLIEAQRAYSLLSRAITTTDDMKATANEIRR